MAGPNFKKKKKKKKLTKSKPLLSNLRSVLPCRFKQGKKVEILIRSARVKVPSRQRFLAS